jgi:hypothetical protein
LSRRSIIRAVTQQNRDDDDVVLATLLLATDSRLTWHHQSRTTNAPPAAMSSATSPGAAVPLASGGMVSGNRISYLPRFSSVSQPPSPFTYPPRSFRSTPSPATAMPSLVQSSSVMAHTCSAEYLHTYLHTYLPPRYLLFSTLWAGKASSTYRPGQLGALVFGPTSKIPFGLSLQKSTLGGWLAAKPRFSDAA